MSRGMVRLDLAFLKPTPDSISLRKSGLTLQGMSGPMGTMSPTNAQVSASTSGDVPVRLDE